MNYILLLILDSAINNASDWKLHRFHNALQENKISKGKFEGYLAGWQRKSLQELIERAFGGKQEHTTQIFSPCMVAHQEREIYLPL